MVMVIHPQHRILLRLPIFRLISHWNQIPPSGSLRIGNELPPQAHSALDNSLWREGGRMIGIMRSQRKAS